MIQDLNGRGALRLWLLAAFLASSLAVGWWIWLAPDDSGAHAGYWVADRDGDRLVRLDSALLVTATLDVRAPVAVSAGVGEMVWTISAAPAIEGAGHRLLAFEPAASDGAQQGSSSPLELHTAREVVPDTRFLPRSGTAVFAVERTGESLRRLHRLGADGIEWSLDLSGAGNGPVPAGGPYEDFVPDVDGGGLLVAAGHVLRVNRWGEAAGGQGGFVFARSAHEVRR